MDMMVPGSPLADSAPALMLDEAGVPARVWEGGLVVVMATWVRGAWWERERICR